MPLPVSTERTREAKSASSETKVQGTGPNKGESKTDAGVQDSTRYTAVQGQGAPAKASATGPKLQSRDSFGKATADLAEGKLGQAPSGEDPLGKLRAQVTKNAEASKVQTFETTLWQMEVPGGSRVGLFPAGEGYPAATALVAGPNDKVSIAQPNPDEIQLTITTPPPENREQGVLLTRGPEGCKVQMNDVDPSNPNSDNWTEAHGLNTQNMPQLHLLSADGSYRTLLELHGSDQLSGNTINQLFPHFQSSGLAMATIVGDKISLQIAPVGR